MTAESASPALAVLQVEELPQAPLDASNVFYTEHLPDACDVLEDEEAELLIIQLPPAGKDHDDWRRALARDLARKYVPKRANVISAASDEAAEGLLAYLVDAPGVTGQYLPSDD